MSLKRQMAKGAGWLMSVRLLNRGVGFFSTIILARLLVPEDFGLVAMAMVVVGLFELLNAYSLQVFLVQKQDLSDRDLNSAWTLQVIFGVLQAALLALLSLPVAQLYGEPRLVSIFLALALTMLICGFKNIGVMYFQRDLRFHMEFLLMGGRKLVAFAVTVALAVTLRNHWALVGGIIAGRCVQTLLTYMLQSYRPRFHLSAWKEVFNFSRWLYANNFLNFMRNKGQEFFIGKLAGAGPLGLFSVSYDIAMLPTTEMVSPINRAVFPGYAKMKNDAGQLRDGYLSVLAIIALVTLPVAVGLSATADVLIPLLLGDKWLEAAPLVQLLAISGAIVALQTNNGAVYVGTGRPWLSTYMNTAWLAVLLPLVISLTLVNGATGAACAYLITTGVMLPVSLALIMRIIHLKFMQFFLAVYRPVTSAIIMYSAVRWLSHFLGSYSPGMGLASTACALVACGALCYLACVLGLWILAGRPNGAEPQFWELLAGILKTRSKVKDLSVSTPK